MSCKLRPWPLKMPLEGGHVTIPIEVSGLGDGKQESVPRLRGVSWGGAVRWRRSSAWAAVDVMSHRRK